MAPLLSVREMSVSYGTLTAVHRASFEMEKGQTVGIVGESACGKSTLGLAIMRALTGGRISGGSIMFDGHTISDMSPDEFEAQYRWSRIAMMFQGAMNSLDPVYTVRQQFNEAIRAHPGTPHNTPAEAVTSVELDESVLDRYPHELSGGMKQRVVMAMALILKPDLVIADEPTTALDVLVQARIINMLKRLREDGTSFLFITHDLGLLSEMADMVGVMYGGQIVEFGPADTIYNDPAHPYTRGLLNSVPRLHGPPPGYIRGSPPLLSEPPPGCRFADRCGEVMEKCNDTPQDYTRGSCKVKCWLYD